MKPASVWDWAGPAALIFIFISYLHLSTPSEIVLCRGHEDCFRDWIGTIASVAAMIATAVAAYFVNGQLAEQRKQNAFLIGDGQPTFEIFLAAMNGHRAVFRLANWNRRIVTVRRIRIEPGKFLIPSPSSLVFHDPDSENVEEKVRATVLADGSLNEIHGANGWIHRQTAPFVLDFEIHFSAIENFTAQLLEATVNDKAKVILTCRIEDGFEKSEDLSVSIEIRDLFPNDFKHSNYEILRIEPVGRLRRLPSRPPRRFELLKLPVQVRGRIRRRLCK